MWRPSEPLSLQSVSAVGDAVGLLVDALGEVPLIGFAGAPFTLASYLVEGGPSKLHERTKTMMLAEPSTWHALMEALTELTIDFLRVQLDAGVDAIQLFDSWAGTLSLADYRSYVLPHSTRVFAALADYGVPMTHFGVGTAELLGAMGQAGATVVGVDWRTSLADAVARIEPGKALQGNLDPVVLLAGWPVVERSARAVVDDGRRAVDAGAAGHIFNLGHGVLPGTDPGCLPTWWRWCTRCESGTGPMPLSAGGISGLVAAYRIRAAVGAEATIRVFDPADRLGGVLRTETLCGQPMDIGAEAFVARRPEVPALLGELGLADRQITTTGVRPTIYSQGRLHPLPPGAVNGIPEFGRVGDRPGRSGDPARIAAEPDRPLQWQPGADPSVGAWWAERFGEQVVTRSVDPMLSGSTPDRPPPSASARRSRRSPPPWTPGRAA